LERGFSANFGKSFSVNTKAAPNAGYIVRIQAIISKYEVMQKEALGH